MQIEQLPVKKIFADPKFNCRGRIIPLDVMELMESIKKNGLLEPIIVQTYKQDGFDYRTIAGHRRLMAFELLGKELIPAIVRTDLTDVQAMSLNLIENLDRKDLTVMQEARAIEKFRGLVTLQEIGKIINKSYGWVQIRMNALQLPPEIQAEIEAGIINTSHIKDIYSLKSKEAQFEIVREIKDAKLRGDRRRIFVKQVKKRDQDFSVRTRNQSELFQMQDVIRETFGNSLTTVVLGWASAQVSTNDMYAELERLAKEKGVTLRRENP